MKWEVSQFKAHDNFFFTEIIAVKMICELTLLYQQFGCLRLQTFDDNNKDQDSFNCMTVSV